MAWTGTVFNNQVPVLKGQFIYILVIRIYVLLLNYEGVFRDMLKKSNPYIW